MRFENKTIFIISYEEWGDMLMSKHHYAIELSKRNNKVYFINHPDRKHRLKRGEIRILNTSYKNLFSVHHRLLFPYFIKFKAKRFYHFLVGLHLQRLIRKLSTYPDIVWSFDAGNSLALSHFSKAALRIYMPVDGPFGHKHELDAANKADIIISVTENILGRYKSKAVPKLLVHHGVADLFINDNVNIDHPKSNSVHVGYSGSLIRNDIDFTIIRSIIKDHPKIIFEFWGEIDPATSTIHFQQDVSDSTLQFLDFLRATSNVILHGPTPPEILAKGLKRMDILLVAYDVKQAQNSHKILEYLATGNVIVASFIKAYESKTGLIEMVDDPYSNDMLKTLFERVINGLDKYQVEKKRQLRTNYARQYTYSKLLRQIENRLPDLGDR